MRRQTRTLVAAAVSVTLVALAATPGLGATDEPSAFPSPLVGRWSRTVTHAAWLKAGRDFATQRVTLEVDQTGTRVGYFGPDFNPSAVPTGGPANPDWYTDWKIKGRKLTIGAVPPCGWADSWSARYRWATSGKTLKIMKVADKCPDRVAIFAGTWKKST
jgi:hypothetical protein